jgi:hypothetical protein
LQSLFNRHINATAFFLTAIAIRIVFFNISWLSFIALVISMHQFVLLFISIRHLVPVRYLLGSFVCVQFFIGPVLAYNGLDEYQYFTYKMKITETEYFSYAIPAVVSFILGLHISAGKLKGEFIDIDAIKHLVGRNPKLPFLFVGVGFVASVISIFFSTNLAFVFYVLGSFKFIGLFLFVLGSSNIKALPLILVMGSIVSSSLGEGMFHDLITWTIFTVSIFALKYQFDFKTKIIGLSVFVVLIVAIQALKGVYRSSIKANKENAGLETFVDLIEENRSKEDGAFSFKSLAASNVRINQGFIITNIMSTVPSKVPFANGEEMMLIIKSAVLPRVLAPDKLNAGDKKIFTKYSGINLRQGTSMGLSSLGDAYINFGIVGGCIFMFFLGLFYSYVLKLFFKYSKKMPVLLLFTSLVFYYPIRPDCELQTILGHLFKSSLIIIGIFYVWRNEFLNPILKQKPIAS